MEQPSNISLFPVLSFARVIGYDTSNHGVFVQLPSLQAISLSAKILIQGNVDGTRINQDPLPVIGTTGLIAIPFGDTRSAIWLGGFYTSATNAVTTSNPPTDQDSQMKYESLASGSWSLLDYIGNYFHRYADGTKLAINMTNTEPVTYKQILEGIGNPVLVQVTDKMRNQYPPGPFYVSINHPSGASATITPSGMVTITGGNPQLPTIVMTPSGIITVTGADNPVSGSQSSPQIILNSQTGELFIYSQNQNALITMDKNGNIVINGAQTIDILAGTDMDLTANQNITLDANMNLTLTAGADIPVNTNTFNSTVNFILDLINTHVHSGVQSGSSNTGPPTTTIP
jgi:GpV Apex motif